MATRTYHVAVLVEGRPKAIEGPRHADKAEAERELRVINEAQMRDADSVVGLPWLTVRSKAITAASVEARWTGSSVPKAGPPRSNVPSWDYFKDQ